MSATCEALCDWLAIHGAANRPHGERTLLDHLVGTWRLLSHAGLRQEVCLGGLFHSVYGTNAFRAATATPTERPQVIALIGVEAEMLAWIFGHIHRPRILVTALTSEGRSSVTQFLNMHFGALWPELVDDLIAIECANLLDQDELWKTSQLTSTARRLGLISTSGFAKFPKPSNYRNLEI